MRMSRLLFTTALMGVFMFSCEELEIKPDLKHNASLDISANDKVLSGARMASATMDVIDFESYSAGTILSEVTSKNGAGPVKVYGHNPKFPDRNAAMIFDSSNPTGNDPDLGTPHQDFGGPGSGAGGEQGKPHENNTALGKILIITEDFDSTDPDDADLNGSYYAFDFSALGTVTIYSMHIVDVERSENPATITFYDDNGNQIGSPFTLPWTGNNGVHNYFFGEGVSGVAKMMANINGSGAVDNIVFLSEETETPPPAEVGCTNTPGYWKNHTKYSAARRDATWDKIGAKAEDTEFFLSGKTYLEVMQTPPKGNAYYNLSFHYIAAKLNTLRGASAPADVTNAIMEAEKLFQQYTPAQIGAMKGSDAVRKTFLEHAALLDQYNNGLVGPGHCN